MLKKRGWGSWDDPLARATRGLRRMGRVAWSSSCSRNAHDQHVLVRRAHSRIDQATLEIEMGNWEDARSGGLIRAILVKHQRAGLEGSYSVARCGPAWGNGASMGEETVLADSGRAGEIAARVGRVRSLVFLSILGYLSISSL
jgi:hypothetical protein